MKEQLVNYIKAGFPVMAIPSVETARVIDDVVAIISDWNKELKDSNANEVLKTYGYNVRTWNAIDGWMDGGKSLYKGSEDPVKAMQFLLDEKDRKECPACIYVMDSFYHHWDDQMMKPMIYEYIKKFAHERAPHRHILFVGMSSCIPVDISHLFMTVDFALPDKEELLTIVNKFSSVLAKKKKELSVKEKKEIVDAASGMTKYEAENAFRVAIVESKGKEISPKVIQKEKSRAVKKLGFLEYEPSEYTVEDLGGIENLKQYLNDLAYVYHNMEEAKKYGLKSSKGMLVTGISGTGKSLTAKILSNIFGIPLFRADIGKLFGSLVGETEKNTAMFFKQIDSVSPCIILVDEVEKALSGTESSGQSDAGVTSRLMGRLLEYLQEKKSDSFFIFTANDISKLPPELMRKGRIDSLWFFDLPTDEERLSILKIHIKKTKRDPEKFDLAAIVRKTEGCTGAEIEGFIKDAMYKAFPEKVEYTTEHILEAVSNTPLLSKTKEKEITALRQWAKGRARIANYTENNHPAWYKQTEDSIITDDKPKAKEDRCLIPKI
jgi:ATP-dependent 26S proteasome regulatory subunit